MAEFDTAGFSALEQFFGPEGDGANHNNKALGPKHDRTHLTKGNRRGVGSAVPVTATQSDLTKKFLAVGRKRRRGDQDNDDDDDAVDDAMIDGEENDEDEAGRTAIGAPRYSSKADTGTILTQQTKKKLGKKERKKLLQQVVEGASSALSPGSENQKTTETSVLTGDEDVSPKEGESRKKQKRRKVRSKQKNIRKDNREQEQKPNHLIVGCQNYNGRPLTAETRAKLHLPAPKARAALFMEQSHEEDHGQVEVGGLAIDDFLEDDTGKVVETPKDVQADRKTKKKSKRPKYKNLNV